MRTFNTTGVCIPSKHYMVNLDSRLIQIKRMVDQGDYFTINRARQYGKSTTLAALREFLSKEYTVISLDFQAIGNAGFSTEENFVQSFCRLIRREKRNGLEIPVDIDARLESIQQRNEHRAKLDELFDDLAEWCEASENGIVLMIDEVDTASNNQVFLDFLAQLREGYIGRDTKGAPTFLAVILAGVTDIKNLRRKIRPEDGHRFNSPWNIAADFLVDMSFHPEDIVGMLKEYEADHRTGMLVEDISQSIYDYTGGYPYLVSRICQQIDVAVADGKRFRSLKEAWTKDGIDEAVRRILMEKNTLFESLMGKVHDYPELNHILQRILFSGERVTYNAYDISISEAEMYGFVQNDNGIVKVANRIFEVLLYNWYLNTEEMKQSEIYQAAANEQEGFVENGCLNMKHILARFIESFTDIYGTSYDHFEEDEGRRRFLLFIRPIINGTGNYYIEAETRNNRRMDLVIDYLGERYVIELKIWRGNAYNERGERQLSDYLDYYHLSRGYMLSYNFNQNKKTGLHTVRLGEKELIEAVV